MEYRDFVYWLQGFLELSDCNEITKEQLCVIKNHINLVFKYNNKTVLLNETSSTEPIGESKLTEDSIKKLVLRC